MKLNENEAAALRRMDHLTWLTQFAVSLEIGPKDQSAFIGATVRPQMTPFRAGVIGRIRLAIAYIELLQAEARDDALAIAALQRSLKRLRPTIDMASSGSDNQAANRENPMADPELVELLPPYTVQVTANEDGTVECIVMAKPVTPPGQAKPVLVITTPDGTGSTTTQTVIRGTIDLPNKNLDILLDAGPTKFGKTNAEPDGTWAKAVVMTTTGLWTITAHATNSAGTTDSNSVQFQVSNGGTPPIDPPPTGGGSDAPPAPQTRIAAGADRTAIQNAINACPAGGSVVLAAGTCNFGGTVRLKAGVTVWADGVVNINGGGGAGSNGAFDGSGLADWVIAGKAPGQGFVFNGSLINATNAQRWVVACATFNNQASNGYDGSAIRMNGAAVGVIVNNDFNGCNGNLLGMYNLTRITVDGNGFANCRQPISYQFKAITGEDMVVVNNWFTGITRAAMEMGPDATMKQKMTGLKVNNNWFDDFNPDQGTCDAGASLPISLVATGATGSECKDNYIRRGDRPLAVGRPHPAIEFAGSGPCTNNTIDSLTWEGFAYSTGYHYYGNKAFNAPWGFVVGTGGGAGTIEPSQILSSAPPKPPKPTRVAASTYYPWNR